MTEEQKRLAEAINRRLHGVCEEMATLADFLKADASAAQAEEDDRHAAELLCAGYGLSMRAETAEAVRKALNMSQYGLGPARADYIRCARLQVKATLDTVRQACRTSNRVDVRLAWSLGRAEHELVQLIDLTGHEAALASGATCVDCGRPGRCAGPEHAIWCPNWIPF